MHYKPIVAAILTKTLGEAPQGKGALREISKKVASSNWRDVSPEEAKRLLAQLENNSIPKPVSKKNTAKDVGKVYEDVKTMVSEKTVS